MLGSPAPPRHPRHRSSPRSRHGIGAPHLLQTLLPGSHFRSAINSHTSNYPATLTEQTEDNQQTLEGFLDWAGAQPEPDKPVHIQSFQIKDELTAAAYTTGRRIRENGWFDEEDVPAIRRIIREECESFGRAERGEVYKAEIRRPCLQCGHPEAGKPLYEEAGIEGPLEEAIKLMRELIRHNMAGL